MTNTDGIALKIAQYLRGNQDGSGSLWDEHDQAMTPVSHYGLSYFAVAALLLHDRTGDPSWLTAGARALGYYFAQLPAATVGHDRGHKEFNDLAVLLCLREARQQTIDKKLAGLIDTYVLHEIPDSGDVRSGMPNNWVAMRSVCCLLRGEIVPGSAGKNGRWLIDRYILRCQQPDGFFYDMPAFPGLRQGETPLTYHAKICAMLAMAYKHHPAPAVAWAVVRGLDALSAFVAPDAETFYFGRTNNGLFGYASAVYAFARAAAVIPMAEDMRDRYRGVAGQLLGHIAVWQKPDGHVAIAPNPEEARRTGWDGYMHTVVYNAYTAAMLLLSGPIEAAGTERAGTGAFSASDAGLVSLRAPGLFAAVATRGQSVHPTMAYEGARYKGVNVYKLWHDGRDLVAPPEISDAGWPDISLQEGDGTIWACSQTFQDVHCRAADSFLTLTGEGLLENPQGLSVPAETAQANMADAFNRSLERMLPPEVMWWLQRQAFACRTARRGEGLRCHRGLLLDLNRRVLCTISYIPLLPRPGTVLCAIAPPLRDDTAMVDAWASVPASGQQRVRRVVRSSKGTTRQQYLRLICPESGGQCWAVGVYRWNGRQVPVVRGPAAEVILDRYWTIRFDAAGITVSGG